jgi:glutathione S-transferase
MFAPVVLRVRSYGLPISGLSQRYQETMLSDAWLGEWIESAGRETQVIPYEEVGAGA